MRGKDTEGRFTMNYEVASISDGIEYDLQNPVGQRVLWWVYSEEATEVDPVYDVGAYTGGRMWHTPFVLPVVLASIEQGQLYQNDRGFYTLDQLRLIVNATELYSKLPRMAYSPDDHLKDRIEYRGHLFQPTLIYPKGHIQKHLVVVQIAAGEVKPEEWVNDPQFAHVAHPVVRELSQEFTPELAAETPNHYSDEFSLDFYTGVPQPQPAPSTTSFETQQR